MVIARRPACRYPLLPANALTEASGPPPPLITRRVPVPLPLSRCGAVLAQYPFAADACHKLFPSTVLTTSPPARGNAQALLSFAAATRATCLCPGEALVARVLNVVCFQLGPVSGPRSQCI